MKIDNNKSSLRELASSLNDYINDSEVISTDVYPIDKVLNGGLERGSFVQFVAESGIGKTTIALQIAHVLCEKEYNILYIDSEKSVSKEILTTTGVIDYHKKNFFLIKESEFSVVEKTLDQFISTNEIDFVIIDSIASLINECFTNIAKNKETKSIMTNNTSYNSVPLTKFMSKYKTMSGTNNVCFILINQYRYKINMKTGATDKIYGSKNIIYNSDSVIKVSNTNSTQGKEFRDLTKDVSDGRSILFEVIKSNKLRPGFSMPAFLKYGKGISCRWNYIYELIKLGVIKKNVGYYSLEYAGEVIKDQGILNFVNDLENRDLMRQDFFEMLIAENEEEDDEL